LLIRFVPYSCQAVGPRSLVHYKTEHKKSQKPDSDPLLDSFPIYDMNVHPITAPASPSLASPLFDASFDSIESLTTTFTSPVVPTLETTTVTEVAIGYHRNQQYSITAMTTSTGAVAERYAYTAYGQPTILDASGSAIGNQQSQIANRFTYTDREWDETLGLLHFRARWISPLAGRFLGRDPIEYDDGDNLYRVNITLSSLDPEGMAELDADPTSSDGLQWCWHTYDPRNNRGLSVHGELEYWRYNVECKCVCCSTGFCDGDTKRTPRCRVIVRLSVKINKRSAWDKKDVYGHEQIHADNFLKSAKQAQDLATRGEGESGCTDPAECEKNADKIANDAQNILNQRVLDDASPKCMYPRDGTKYQPRHPMPTDPQPECRSPSEVKPFPDWGCLYMPSKK
ncbi:MAG: RHS repeat domain-containing protein, partial [Pirellula sp.]